MPIRSWFLIFVYKHILTAAPNQTEVYTLQISRLSALKMKNRRKRVDFDSWKFPKWHCIHFPLSKSLRHLCPPTHTVHTPRTPVLSDQDSWLPTRLCGLWVILSGNAHEPTLQNSSEGEGTQLLSCCISRIMVTVAELLQKPASYAIIQHMIPLM